MFNMEKRIFITGSLGTLGKNLCDISNQKGIFIQEHRHIRTDFENDGIVYGDITDSETQDRIFQKFKEKNCNVLINNIGVYQYGEFLNLNEKEIFDILNINLISTIILTHKILKHLSTHSNGMIYNINSLAGLKGSPYESVYCASKFGLKGFSDSLSEEFKDHKNIRIVNVSLGAFKSKMTSSRKNYEDLADPHEVAEKIISHILEEYKTIRTELSIFRK